MADCLSCGITPAMDSYLQDVGAEEHNKKRRREPPIRPRSIINRRRSPLRLACGSDGTEFGQPVPAWVVDKDPGTQETPVQGGLLCVTLWRQNCRPGTELASMSTPLFAPESPMRACASFHKLAFHLSW